MPSARDLIGRLCWRRSRSAWVLSTGRVGTKTLVGLASLADRVEAHHEPAPRLRTFAKRAYSDIDVRPEVYRRHFVAARAGRLGWSHLRGRVYVEATNMISFAPMLARELPHAKFIFLHRHPGEVVRSGMRRGWFGPHPWDRYRIEPRPGDPAHALWPTWDAFHKICWVWQAVNGFILDFRESVAPDRVLSLPFQDMVDPTSGAYEKLFAFLDVRCPQVGAVREVLAIRDNAQEAGAFPRYRDWTDSQRRILHDIAGPVMRRLGYADQSDQMGEGGCYADAA